MTERQLALMRIETEILISAPITQVWDILTDYANYSIWNPYIVQIDGIAQAGSLIDVHSMMITGSAPIVAPVLVISVDPYEMRWEGGLPDRSKFKGDHFFSLDARYPQTTRLCHHEDFSGTQAMSIMTVHCDNITSNFNLFNEALKRRAEMLAPI